MTAALINGVVNDLLYQVDFQLPHYPEWVDLAVVATGLGVLRSGVGFVKKTGLYWDSTQWSASPRPFLNIPSLAYANALAAWTRGEKSPAWVGDLNGEIKRPMRSSLKFLQKTEDSFFKIVSADCTLAQTSQADWWSRVADDSVSTKVIALGQIQCDGEIASEHESCLVASLRSNNRSIVLHSIAAVERLGLDSETIAQELRSLVSDRDDEIRAKSLCTLTTLGGLDETTIGLTDEMLESHFKHNVFAAVFALSTIDSLPEFLIPSVQRAFMRALKSCDYEFVGLFAAAYKRWFEDPESQVEEFLHDSPELLPIAIEALEDTPQELVSL